MSKSVNKLILLGNVGKAPDVFATGAGGVVCKFSVATSDRYKDSEGNWQDRTEWTNVVSFGQTAEFVQEYVTKGSKVYVEGRLQTSSWDDKNSGEKRYKVECIANQLILVSGKTEDREERPVPAGVVPDDSFDEDSEIPF